MLNRFLYRVVRFLNRKFNAIEVAMITDHSFVRIHSSFNKGYGSDIVLQGDGRELTIEEDVICRNFCNFLLYPEASLIIRKNVFFNNYCSVNCLGKIEIGENTLFGEGVKIYDHNHLYKRLENDTLCVERGKFAIGSVKIGKNCWIGSNVTILNNVQIGDNVIIGANCLIHKSVEANSIIRHKEEFI